MKISDRFERFKGYNRKKDKYKIKLDKNESPLDLPSKLKDEIFDELTDIPLNRYPQINSEGLRKKVSDYIGFTKENIIVGNGSDAILPLLFKLFDTDQVVINSPTFDMYSFYAKREGLTLVDVPLDDNFQIVNLGDKIDKPSIICICSPNSPTGNIQPREKIIDVLETDNLVILDEAYVDFSKETNIDLIQEYDNLIVLRTLSKAFGLAGLRIGYAVAKTSIISKLNKIKSPFNMNIMSTKIAEKVLENKEIVSNNKEYIIKERERITKEFEEYAYPSHTNFILLDLDAYDYLRKRSILVRKMKGRLEGMIRLTVGTKEENDILISALKEFIGD